MKNYKGQECICISEMGAREVKIGELVYFSDGNATVVQSFSPPHKASSTGRICVKADGDDYSREYFPGVFGCRFVP